MKKRDIFRHGFLSVLLLLPAKAIQAQPANDDFDAATIVAEPLPFNDAIFTGDATTAPDDPDCAGNGPTVWYAYTPSNDGTVQANTFGSDYDTTLSVYSGSRGSLEFIACNDDSGSLQSRVQWDGEAGITYYLMVGAFASGPGGNLNFTVDEAPPPALQNIMLETTQAVPKTGVARVQVTAHFSRPVFVEFADGSLLQRSGRGSIFSNAGKFVGEETDMVSTTLFFEPFFEAKGFVGGPAEACVGVGYFDPATGAFESGGDCFDIKLQGSRDAGNGN